MKKVKIKLSSFKSHYNLNPVEKQATGPCLGEYNGV